MTVNEESTLVVLCEFLDEDGLAVTPTSASWTLTDEDGNVVNSRSAVALSPSVGSATVVMTGADLAMTPGHNGKRKLLVEALYNSTRGTGLYLKKEYAFSITNLVGVS